MTPKRTNTGMPYLRLEENEIVRLEVEPGVHIEVRKHGMALDVRTAPRALQVMPLDSTRILVVTL